MLDLEQGTVVVRLYEDDTTIDDYDIIYLDKELNEIKNIICDVEETMIKGYYSSTFLMFAISIITLVNSFSILTYLHELNKHISK